MALAETIKDTMLATRCLLDSGPKRQYQCQIHSFFSVVKSQNTTVLPFTTAFMQQHML
jgi:hypothetical protein